MTDTDPTLAAIEQRAQSATEGPWSLANATSRYGQGPTAEQLEYVFRAWTDSDAEFIAHARTDVPYLLDRHRAVTAERDEARRSADYAWKQTALARIDRDHARDQVAAVRAEVAEHRAVLTGRGRFPERAEQCHCLGCACIQALDSVQPQDTPGACSCDWGGESHLPHREWCDSHGASHVATYWAAQDTPDLPDAPDAWHLQDTPENRPATPRDTPTSGQ